MTIGECKKGDVVWIADFVASEPVQVEVQEDCADGEYLMPRKRIRLIWTSAGHAFLTNELFYSTPCYTTFAEAEVAMKKVSKLSNLDTADSFRMLDFSLQNKKIDCLEAFIKQEGLWEKYLEFKKESNKEASAGDTLIDYLHNELLADQWGKR